MKKTNWFSLLEIIIIISLILVFMLIFRNQLIPKNVQTYKWQTCVNDLHNFIQSFVTAWLTNKWIYSWQDLIYPEKYTINIKTSENKVTKQISWNILETVNLSWEISSQNICYIDNNYKIFLTGNDLELEINKWGLSNQFNLSLSWIKVNSWETNILLCKNEWSDCKKIWQYLIDKRSQTIIKRVCLAFSWSDCIKWNE